MKSMNAGSNAVAIFAARTEEQVAEYFTEHRATSPSWAIDIHIPALRKSLEAPEFLELPLERYGFIRKTRNGQYYMDTVRYAAQRHLIKTFIIAILLIAVSVSLLSILFGISGYLTNTLQ